MARLLLTVDDEGTRVGGHALFRGGDAALLASLRALRGDGVPRLVVTPNVDQVLRAASDPVAARAFSDASVLLADGAPLVALARALGDGELRRHTGADLLDRLTAEAASTGWRVAIVGGRPEVARAAARRLREAHPGAAVHAVETPALASADDPAGEATVERLRGLRPDVVFLCLGFPLQEAWWSHWRDHLPGAVYVGAGAAVDFAAGARSRAPQAVQRLGLEWCWRLAQEPRRLAYRYLVRGPRFLAVAARSLRHSRHARRARMAGPTAEPRVLHAVDSMAQGGAQQVVLDLASWSASTGVPTAIVAADGPRASDVPDDIGFERAPDGSVGRYLISLFLACLRFRPTVLHAHQRREALACLVVGRLLRIPVVEHAHTVLPDTRLRALSFRTRRVFSVGPAVTRMLTDTFGVADERVRTIGNLVPPAALTAGPPLVHDAARRTSARADTVLGVGRLEEQKDPLRFVDIVAAGAGRLRGRWLGEGPLRSQAEWHARTAGAPVEFRGRTTAVIAEMDSAGVLLLTSRWEGTPLVVLEAFARGLLVVAIEAPGVTELVAGRGLLLPQDVSATEAAAAVERALRTDTSALREAARAYAHRQSDPEVVFGPVLDAYRELTAAGG
jgi:N-acetylglucosaminyldiphosphoundecaprenol N-acetyl-beta-D-mannosaminyltransferase